MVSASPFAAAQADGGHTRYCLTVLDFSQDRADVATERPRGLVSHDLAAIKVMAVISSCVICRRLLRCSRVNDGDD